MTPYTKPSTSIEEQITLLTTRKLVIDDIPKAKYYLNHIGYYRLTGYWLHYQEDKVNHIFCDNTKFEQIIELYNFDRKLRLILFDAIERIEVSFRSVLINEMCQAYGASWYANRNLSFNDKNYEENLGVVMQEFGHAKEDFIGHHERNYGSEEVPPAWKAMQVVSFGTLSKIYSNIDNNVPERKRIANIFGFKGGAEWIESFLQVVAVLRNYCAHHSRLCYRRFTSTPKTMGRPAYPWIQPLAAPGGLLSKQLYYQICVVRYLLFTAYPETDFNEMLRKIVGRFSGVKISQMGFPDEWEKEPLWACK
ncbi:MAG: Abi family protein [Chitinophaga sp.]|uniref:Abi family protein n=1 Tax=Chitinophaga sp. TaxID=1869181 RepID=UPI001B1B0279|nr:Abi family protein [Chitinophaga sp.]MBO9728001.1 Abi family protein [Chitinophaga sp.]